MQIDLIIYISYSSISITILLLLALLFWHRRGVAGAKGLSVMMISATAWGGFDFLSDLSSNFRQKLFWQNLSYLGVVSLPVIWFIFTLQYTNKSESLSHKKKFGLFLIPLVTTVLLWTNRYHHLVMSEVRLVKISDIEVVGFIFNSWFWIHAMYSYTLLVGGIIILVKYNKNMPEILKKQTQIIIVSIVVPIIISVSYLFGIHPPYPFDFTISSFSFTGLLCFYAIFRHKLFDLISIARNAVIENMNEVMIVLDKGNRIIDMNSSARNLFNINLRDNIGDFAKDVLDGINDYLCEHDKNIKVDKKIHIETEDGLKYFDLKIKTLYDDLNTNIGKFVIMHDITNLENINSGRSRFLTTMSHEIRTPLNGIIGLTELLSSAKYTEKEREYFNTVQDCAEDLLNIINDILDLSKIDSGKIEVERIAFDLKKLIKDVIKQFYIKVDKVELKYSFDDSIPDLVIGDSVKIKQILINLIGNAVKFTERGTIEITARVIRNNITQNNIEFSIKDTGIGIPENKKDRLFKRFNQLDTSNTRKYGGTGLGLSIVKELVTMLEGTINVESQIGKGSNFIVNIPFLKVSNKNTTVVPNHELNIKNKDICILLAEDNKANQMFIVNILEKQNVKVDVANNGEEVLCMLDEKSYQLILMDIQMPIMDGYDTTIAIRNSDTSQNKYIPIIALTANATEEDKNRCLELGMNDYLTKPLKSKKLYECIDKYINE